MPSAFHAEKLAIGHVGDPRQRKPVGGIEGRQRPHQAIGGEAGAHVNVLADVFRVVVIDEIVVPDLAVNG